MASLRRGIHGPSSTENPRNGQMQGLLTEFRGVYESRLRRLDDAERHGEDTQKVIQCIWKDLHV